MAKRSMFVGMDVHKESIDISLAEEGRDGEVRHYGVAIGSRPIGGTATPWPGCIAPASLRRSTFRHPMMKPSVISCARAKTRSA